MTTNTQDYLSNQLTYAKDQAHKWTLIAQGLDRMIKLVNTTKENESLQSLSGPATAEIVLQAAGKPLHITEIINRMKVHGYLVKSNTYGSLYTSMLRQKNRFRMIGKAQFTLTDPSSSTPEKHAESSSGKSGETGSH